jgi:hypothetical protein
MGKGRNVGIMEGWNDGVKTRRMEWRVSLNGAANLANRKTDTKYHAQDSIIPPFQYSSRSEVHRFVYL